jgi:predicted metalloenzyme YecM
MDQDSLRFVGKESKINAAAAAQVAKMEVKLIQKTIQVKSSRPQEEKEQIRAIH